MLVFGHTGITLGTALLVSGLARTIRKSGAHVNEAATTSVPESGHASPFTYLAQQIDIRLLLAASVLPDIIDKPLGHIFFTQQLSNGRTFAHTLLFFLLLAVPGALLLFKKRKAWLLVVSSGVFMHLVLDQMWRTPATLFWPLFGFSFGKKNISDWLPGIFHSLATSPSVYIPEIIGGAILVWLAVDIWRRRSVRAFIRHGEIL